MSLTIYPIPAFNDNYLWILHDQQHAVVVDPGDETPVQQYLSEHQLKLTAILITHHHHDHIGGVNALQSDWACPVYAPEDDRLTFSHRVVNEGDTVQLDSPQMAFSVLQTPGHTRSHICYFDEKRLFCGDTLFSGGCGRMFEGTPEQFTESLNKINQLNGNIKVYCTHEYTSDNLRFARQAEPDNQTLADYQQQVSEWRSQGLPSLPSTLAKERQINPFLRTGQPAVQKSVSQHWQTSCQDHTHCFALLRKWKDNF
jgi:hydroxyacylglutathione hydrolase